MCPIKSIKLGHVRSSVVSRAECQYYPESPAGSVCQSGGPSYVDIQILISSDNVEQGSEHEIVF